MGFWPATLGRDRVDGTEIVRAVDPDGPAGPDQLQRADVLAITRPGQAIAAGERIEVMALA